MPSILFIGSQYTGGGIFMMRIFSNKSILFIAILLFLFIVTSIITLNPPKVQAANFGNPGIGSIKYIWLHTNGNIRAVGTGGQLAEFNYVTWSRLGSIGIPVENSSYDESRRVICSGRSTYNIDTGQVVNYTNLPTNSIIFKGKAYVLDEGSESSQPKIMEYNLDGSLSRQLSNIGISYNSRNRLSLQYFNHSNNTFIVAEYWGGPGPTPYNYTTKYSVINANTLTVVSTGYHGGAYPTYIDYYPYTRHYVSSNYYKLVNNGSEIFRYNLPNSNAPVSINMDGAVIVSKANYATRNGVNITDQINAPITAMAYDKFGNRIVGTNTGLVYVLDYAGNPSQDTTFYSDYLSADAVTEARLAKEAALTASSEAKQAKEKTNEAIDLINSLDTKFSAQLNIIQEQMQPVILSVKTTNGATATKSGSINIVATAINASQYRYRVNNGAYSEWQLLPVLNINSLSLGVNVIEVQAANSLEDGAPVASGYVTVFRL